MTGAIVRGAGWVAPAADVDPADQLQVRGLRPLSRASRLACAAAARALDHPGPLPASSDRCAVVLGTRFASVEPLVEFNHVALSDGPALVNPSRFPNVVVNAHAGYLGILFRLAGPNVTLCGEGAGVDALAQALDLLELGRADAVLAGGVDASGPTLLEGLRRVGADQFPDAAAFVVLAREGVGPTLQRAEIDELAQAPPGAAVGVLPYVERLAASGTPTAAARPPSQSLSAPV